MKRLSLAEKILIGDYLTRQGNASTLRGQLTTVPSESERYGQIEKAIKKAEEDETLYLKESVRNLPKKDWEEMMYNLRLSMVGKPQRCKEFANLFIDVFYGR